MPPALYDAHCHWQDERLAPHRTAIREALQQTDLRRAVVNGTRPQDWGAVAALAKEDARVLPAFGVHPWHVNATCGRHKEKSASTPPHAETGGHSCGLTGDLRSADPQRRTAVRTANTRAAPPEQLHRPSAAIAPRENWLQKLEALLAAHPKAAVGEIGLDRWIEGADIDLQTEVFLTQLAIAARDNRPVSIHCLRADADLLRALKAAPALPARGIHLHGFAGSVETARQLLDYGAYFSFSEYIADPRRAKARAVAAMIPLGRLLVETDAPDMMGPPEWQHYRLPAQAATTQHSATTGAKHGAATDTGHSAAAACTLTPAPPHDAAARPDESQPAAKPSAPNKENAPAARQASQEKPADALAKLTHPPKHPANITAAYACLAELRGLRIEELAATVEENFLRYFGS